MGRWIDVNLCEAKAVDEKRWNVFFRDEPAIRREFDILDSLFEVEMM
jgi:hypothetical protein